MVSKTTIQAAGGVVCAPDGRFLMIFRRGFWDLPKGKLEPGETIEQCAVREVEEECGVSGLTLGRKICTTVHRYTLGGLDIEKHSTWFFMTLPSAVDLVPQKEEDIEIAQWVSPADLPERLKLSYPTIAEVFGALASFVQERPLL